MEIENIVQIINDMIDSYSVLSVVGGLLQVILLVTRRTNNCLMALGLIMDAVGLSGLSFGHFLLGEPGAAISDIICFTLDIAFVLYIIYRDEHPKQPKEPKKSKKQKK